MKNAILLASTARAAVIAFENRKAGWKLDADGKIEMKDGNPVWVDANGAEAVMAGDTIARLNAEAKGHRERAEAAEAKVKVFGDLDPEAARKAIDTIGKIDAKKLIDAGEVDKVKETIKAEFTAQLTEKEKALNDATARMNEMMVGQVFASSDFIRDRVAMPRDFFEASMRSHFKVEDGKVVPYDRAGNRLMSKAKIGELADPNEALELLIDMHPQKDTILKAAPAGGSGNNGGGGNRGTGRVITRASFEAMTPGEKAQAGQAMGKGELTVTD